MPISRAYPLSPTYAVDLRRLVDHAMGDPAPVPAEPVADGTFGARIAAPPPASADDLIAYAEIAPRAAAASGVRIVPPEEYWELALPHRLIVVGPLLDLARLDMETESRLEAERRLLEAYHDRYLGVPLPPRVVAAIRDQAIPGEGLAAWLDAAREEVMTAESIPAANTARGRLRLDALRRGATGAWRERTVAIAEIMTDILLLCHAARGDIEHATRGATLHSGSISLALQAAGYRGETRFESVLPLLLLSTIAEDDLADEERESIRGFAGRRFPRWRDGLLFPRTPEATPRLRITADEDGGVADRDGVSKTTEPVETAAECYARILGHLEAEIVARPELCRHLSLVGVAHLYGVTHQRVLLCGPTGSGKTHAARTLSHALGKPYLQIDMSDVTATGWKGIDLPDALAMLARRAGNSLDGMVLHLDEIDKVRVGAGAEGNSLEAKLNLQASLLALVDGQPVTPDSGDREQLQTARLLVIGTGAFGGRFTHDPPSTEDLVRWGWMPELAARWGERLCLGPLGRSDAFELLRRSERSVERRLGPLMEALGLRIVVPDEVLAYVVDRWMRTGADFRSASDWLLAAAGRRLIRALEHREAEPIVLAPDDVLAPRRSGGAGRPSR